MFGVDNIFGSNHVIYLYVNMSIKIFELATTLERTQFTDKWACLVLSIYQMKLGCCNIMAKC